MILDEPYCELFLGRYAGKGWSVDHWSYADEFDHFLQFYFINFTAGELCTHITTHSVEKFNILFRDVYI